MRFCKTAVFIFTICFTMIFATAQEDTRSEVTVEDEYFGTTEDLVITEIAASADMETKLFTLQYIQTALDQGRISPAIEGALHKLVGESIFTESRTAGRIDNNFTLIRERAARMLAQVPTEATKDLLLALIREEKEPMIVSAAIYALGEIGINTNDEVINQLSLIQRRFSILNSSDSLTYEILLTYEKLIPSVTNLSAIIESVAGIATDHTYILPVRQKAKDMLFNLTSN